MTLQPPALSLLSSITPYPEPPFATLRATLSQGDQSPSMSPGHSRCRGAAEIGRNSCTVRLRQEIAKVVHRPSAATGGGTATVFLIEWSARINLCHHHDQRLNTCRIFFVTPSSSSLSSFPAVHHHILLQLSFRVAGNAQKGGGLQLKSRRGSFS